MNLENFLSPCRNGRVIKNSRGLSVYVPCGHCPDCYNRRAQYYTNLCQTESMSHQFTYFYTLTYNDVDVPKALVCDNSFGTVSFVDITRRLRYGKHGQITSCKRVPEYGQELCTLSTTFDDPVFQLFLSQSNKVRSHVYDTTVFDENPVVRYLRKKDIQDHFKRLRHHIGKVCPTKISYFASGEYGPTTFRPHIHVLLYFDNPALIPHLEELVHKAWTFGRIDGIEAVKSGSQCGNYVAGYLNSFTRLPRFLDDPTVAPFLCHSLNFGTKVYSYLRDYFYENPHLAFTTFDIPSDVGVYTHFPTSRFSSTLFPRCYGYDDLNRQDRMFLYTFIKKSAQIYGVHSVPLLALSIVADPNPSPSVRRFLSLLELCPDVVPSGSFSVVLHYDPSVFASCSKPSDVSSIPPVIYSVERSKHFEVSYDPVSHCADWSVPHDAYMDSYEHGLYQQVYSRVLSALYLSRHFFRFCVGVDYHPDFVLDTIDAYYNLSKHSQLCSQYTAMQEFSFEPSFDGDYTLFFPIDRNGISASYELSRKLHPFIKYCNAKKDSMYESNIKHKELNDANLIFIN